MESGSCAHNKKTMSVAGPCTGQEQGTTEDKQGIRCSFEPDIRIHKP